MNDKAKKSKGAITPYSEEAERSLIGALLYEGEAFYEVNTLVSADDFANPKHATAFASISQLARKGGHIDVVMVLDRLKETGKLQAAGGAEYVRDMFVALPTSANARAYAKIVRGLSVRRQLASAAQRIGSKAHLSGGDDTERLLDWAEGQIYAIADNNTAAFDREHSMLDPAFFDEVVDWIRDRVNDSGALSGLTTGIDGLDNVTGGLQNGDLIIIAGRPSLGKTSLALTMARAAALNEDNPASVLFFSMEMPKMQMVLRMISSLSGIHYTDFPLGRIEGEKWALINSAIKDLKGAHFCLDDSQSLTADRVRSRARRMASAEQHQGRRLGLVVIDYLQLMDIGDMRDARDPTRSMELAHICKSLKGLARELNLPVLLLSQLNREVERRASNVVRLSDLRDSGAIEQDADVVIFIGDGKEQEGSSALHDEGTPRMLYIAKHRNGPTGDCEVFFDGPTMTFKSADQAPQEPLAASY